MKTAKVESIVRDMENKHISARNLKKKLAGQLLTNFIGAAGDAESYSVGMVVGEQSKSAQWGLVLTDKSLSDAYRAVLMSVSEPTINISFSFSHPESVPVMVSIEIVELDTTFCSPFPVDGDEFLKALTKKGFLTLALGISWKSGDVEVLHIIPCFPPSEVIANFDKGMSWINKNGVDKARNLVIKHLELH